LRELQAYVRVQSTCGDLAQHAVVYLRRRTCLRLGRNALSKRIQRDCNPLGIDSPADRDSVTYR